MKQQCIHRSTKSLYPGWDVADIMETFYKKGTLLYVKFKR